MAVNAKKGPHDRVRKHGAMAALLFAVLSVWVLGTAAVPELRRAGPAISVPAARLPAPLASSQAMQVRGPAMAAPSRRELALVLPPLSATEQAQLDLTPKPGAPQRIGVWRAVPAPERSATVAALGGGAFVSYYRLTSPGAVALRVAISLQDLPAGSRVLFLTADDVPAGTIEPGAAEPGADQLRWSPRIAGDTLVIEVRTPEPAIAPVSEWLARVSHQVFDPQLPDECPDGALTAQGLGDAGWCHLDVTCEADWEPVANTVARMIYEADGAMCTCTGTLLNNSQEDFTPYFLTANHCISTQASASSLVTDWFFQSSACNSGTVSARLASRSGGAELLTSDPGSDTTLLRLAEMPPAGAFFSGWTTQPVTVGTAITGVHHPAGDLKRISHGQIAGFADCETGPGTEDGFRCYGVAQGDASAQFQEVRFGQGTVECGSSGSGVFLSDVMQLVGTLYGGSSSCTNPGGYNVYGRFDRAFTRSGWAQYLVPDASTGPDRDGDGIEDRLDPYPNDPSNDTSERNNTAWRVAEVFMATLDRALNAEGADYWSGMIDSRADVGLETLASNFFENAETQTIYPPSMSTAKFVEAVYRNVLGRPPLAQGLSYWSGAIDRGEVRRDQMIVAVIDGAWANAEAFRNGDIARFRNRVLVARAFADYQRRNGIVYSRLSGVQQQELLSAARRVLDGVEADEATRESAIATIPSLLGSLSGGA